MELVTASNISFSFGLSPIVSRASLRVLEKSRIGLTGPNGAGKTTLFRLLLPDSDLEPDEGSIRYSPDLGVGYAAQIPDVSEQQTVEQAILAPLAPYQEALSRAETALSTADSANAEQLLAAYQRAVDAFEAAGGYDALATGLAALDRLGCPLEPDRELSSLSGGQLSLVGIASAVIHRPQLLFLDEPGNHLDYKGLEWLEEFIRGYPGAVLLISHNRYLLDTVCTEIWHLQSGELDSFTGTYTMFRADLARRRADRDHDFRIQDRRARELELRVKQLRSIASSQYNPPAQVLNKLGAAKRKLAEAEEQRGDRPDQDRKIQLDLSQVDRTRADIAIEVSDLELHVGGQRLLGPTSFLIEGGQIVGLVGTNGCGKTSLLKRILEEGSWDNPQIRIGPSMKIGYLSQVPNHQNPKGTIMDEVRSWGPLSRDQAFDLTKPFLFAYRDMEKVVETLSGGEQNRLQLARLFYSGANLLILDEPTNHMDIPSREAIEAALDGFKGTAVIVSHDRYLLDSVAQRTLGFHAQGLHDVEGGFSAWLGYAKSLESAQVKTRT